jgi:hypothetical protein
MFEEIVPDAGEVQVLFVKADKVIVSTNVVRFVEPFLNTAVMEKGSPKFTVDAEGNTPIVVGEVTVEQVVLVNPRDVDSKARKYNNPVKVVETLSKVATP